MIDRMPRAGGNTGGPLISADKVSFDGTGTDLLSTDVEGAIKELNDNVLANFDPNPIEYDLAPYLNTDDFIHNIGFSKVLKYGRFCLLTIKYLQPVRAVTEIGARNMHIFDNIPEEICPVMDMIIVHGDTNHAVFETINGVILPTGSILLTYPGKNISLRTDVYISTSFMYISKK